MALESNFNYISDLNTSNPAAGDTRTEGDDHLRGIKSAVKGSFPNFTGAAVTSTEAELNYVDVTPGTATASKAVVLDGSKAISTITTATITNLNSTTVNIDGGAIDGTTVGASSASTGAFTTLSASTSLALATGATVTGILDEDTMATDSATQLATQQSIKAYSDSKISTDPSGTGTLSTGGTMEVFVSTATTYTAAGQVLTPQAHGLSGTPHEVIAYVECISAEHGYSIGDRAMVNLVDNGNGFIHGIMSWCDGTYIGGGVLNSGISLRHKTTVGSSNVVLSTSSWEIYVVAKYYT